ERAVVGAHSARVLPHVRLRCSRWRDRRDLHSFPTRRSSDLAGLREGFPEACLNALLLAPDGLYVICSAGSAAPPLAAFAARGFGPERLPPGHDGSYNTMWTTVSSSGARLVTTTGIDLEGWQRLPADTVSLITAHGDRQLPIPPAP